MAEAMKRAEYEIDTSQMRTVPANRFGIVINDSDVSLYFGSYISVADTEKTELHSQIVMSFGQFIELVEQYSKRSQVIKAMFGDNALAISQVDKEKAAQAWSILVNKPISDDALEEE